MAFDDFDNFEDDLDEFEDDLIEDSDGDPDEDDFDDEDEDFITDIDGDDGVDLKMLMGLDEDASDSDLDEALDDFNVGEW